MGPDISRFHKKFKNSVQHCYKYLTTSAIYNKQDVAYAFKK